MDLISLTSYKYCIIEQFLLFQFRPSCGNDRNNMQLFYTLHEGQMQNLLSFVVVIAIRFKLINHF